MKAATFAAVITFAVVTVAGCATDAYGDHHQFAKEVSTSEGTVLANRDGMTLYTFINDAPEVSNCNGGKGFPRQGSLWWGFSCRDFAIVLHRLHLTLS